MVSGNLNYESQIEGLKLPIHGVRLPTFIVSEAHLKKFGLDNKASNYDFLKALINDGFRKKLERITDKTLREKYKARCLYELSMFSELGFVDYVLLVWDVVNFCREKDIATGMGRGSCCGSLILYLIDVTKIDSIKYELYFERFVSKIRAKKTVVDGITYLDGSLLMDVDLDIAYEKRHQVIEYLNSKYAGKTSKILTLNTLSGKLLIKEVGKVVGGKNETEMNRVSAMIPKLHGIVKDITTAYEEVKEFKEWCDENRDVYDISLKLRDLIKNKGAHASGYVVSFFPIQDVCPVELTSDKELIAGYTMDWISLFTVKLDMLGLRSASLVHEVCKLAKINMEELNPEDPKIYKVFQNLTNPHGIFQVESSTNFRVLQKVKPKNLEQLSGVLALARPGALAFVDQYAEYTNDGIFKSVHPFFDSILKETGGVPLYQEQLMKMANKVGFTLDEAEVLRRIVGKKKVHEVEAWKKKISDKVKENGLETEIGDILFKLLDDSASYSFNKSHSVAYSVLSALTAYLKFTYPKEFFLALLRLTRFEPDPIGQISLIQPELRHFGIKLLPPHLIESKLDFSIQGDNIRFGLLSIKGISDKSIEKINQFRNKHSNKFQLFQAANEAKLSIGVLSALIQAGALEGFNTTRSKTVLEAQLWNILSSKEKRFAMMFGDKFSFDLPKVVMYLKTFTSEGKPVIKPSRFETIKKRFAPYKEIYKMNARYEDFANWYYEKALLGFTYGVTLLDIFKKECPSLIPVESAASLLHQEYCTFIGSAGEVYEGISKTAKKTKYLRTNVQDETGNITVLMFNDKIEIHKHENGQRVEEGNIVIVRGKKFNDAIFAESISIQDARIYMKLSELKDKGGE